MKYLLITIAILIAISCDSPFDVPASKGDKKVVKDPYLNNPILKFEPDSIDFGFVFPGETAIDSIVVINISNNVVYIESPLFYNELYTSSFSELFLNPVGQNNNSEYLEVVFNMQEPGLYIDSMIIDDMYRPTLYLNAKVPHIFGRDIDFGKVEQSQIIGSIINIENYSEDSVTLKQMDFLNNSEFRFSQAPTLPIGIPPKSSLELLIRFYSETSGIFEDEVRIEIEENLIIKQNIRLKAIID